MAKPIRFKSQALGGVVRIDQLTDLLVSSPENNQFLVWQSDDGKWHNLSVGLYMLSDVEIENPETNHVLLFDEESGKWYNDFMSLSYLADVNINPATLEGNEILVYNGGTEKWEVLPGPTTNRQYLICRNGVVEWSVPSWDLKLTYTLKNSGGSTIDTYSRAATFIRGAQRHWYILTTNSNQDITGIDGMIYVVTSPLAGSSAIFALGSAIEDDSVGIVIGDDDTLSAMDDYCLGSQIPHGTGSGELSYGVCTVTHSESAGKDSVIISRVFINDSGGVVNYAEIGLVCLSRGTPTPPPPGSEMDAFFLCARDVLPWGESIPNGYSLTVVYEMPLNVEVL